FVAGFIGTMNLIEGDVAGGTFAHSGLSVPVAAVDGPTTLAVRPEALALVPGEAGASVHRVTDYGTHAIVDLTLPDGLRLKAMTPDARAWQAGQRVGLRPRAFAAYRDNAVLFRSI